MLKLLLSSSAFNDNLVNTTDRGKHNADVSSSKGLVPYFYFYVEIEVFAVVIAL